MSNSFNRSNNYKITSNGYLSGSHVNFNNGIRNNNSHSFSVNGSQSPVYKHHDNDNNHHHHYMYYNYYGFNGSYNNYPFYYYNEIPYILDTDILSDKYNILDNKCYDIVKKKEILLERGTTKDCEKWCNSIDENNNLVFSNMSPSSNNKCQCFIKTGKKMCS